MKRYKIVHHTSYTYQGDVELGLHKLRLRPRTDHDVRIESFKLNITPPAHTLWHRDVEGTSVLIAKFNTPCQQLLVESEVIIQQFNETPLDFVVSGYAVDYPFEYHADDSIVLAPYRTLPDEETTEFLHEWIGHFWRKDEPIQSYALLQRLAEYIFKSQTYRLREEPGVQSALETLSLGAGSCRDFAFLFMQAARCLGLAARFVSGYLHAPLMAHMAGATHAWAEVYLPGAGWKGFDPTIGQVVGTDHIPVAVAVARLPESVPPIEGSYIGAPGSIMRVCVWVSECEDEISV